MVGKMVGASIRFFQIIGPWNRRSDNSDQPVASLHNDPNEVPTIGTCHWATSSTIPTIRMFPPFPTFSKWQSECRCDDRTRSQGNSDNLHGSQCWIPMILLVRFKFCMAKLHHRMVQGTCASCVDPTEDHQMWSNQNKHLNQNAASNVTGLFALWKSFIFNQKDLRHVRFASWPFVRSLHLQF